MMADLPKMLKLRDAAAATGLSYAFLRQLCIEGEVFSIRSGSKWLVNSDSLAAYLGNKESD